MKENKKMNAQQHIYEMAGLVLKMSLVRLIKIVQKKTSREMQFDEFNSHTKKLKSPNRGFFYSSSAVCDLE